MMKFSDIVDLFCIDYIPNYTPKLVLRKETKQFSVMKLKYKLERVEQFIDDPESNFDNLNIRF